MATAVASESADSGLSGLTNGAITNIIDSIIPGSEIQQQADKLGKLATSMEKRGRTKSPKILRQRARTPTAVGGVRGGVIGSIVGIVTG